MARKHIHKYQKVDIGRKNGPNDRRTFIVFKCVLPSCTHYINEDLAEGKFTLCNRCNNVMVLNKAAMMLKKPHCTDCTKPKHKPALPDLSELLKDKGVE